MVSNIEIEKSLNFDINDYSNLDEISTRLLKSWHLFKSNNIYQLDFEMMLREYILFKKQQVNIFNYQLSNLGKEIGLRQNGNTFWAEEKYPNYLIHKSFIQNVFMLKKAKQLKKYDFNNLSCSLYLRELTGFKRYKSEEQKLSIIGSLNAPKGSTILVSMPTGSGKSLIIQSVAFQESGLTLVIVPTISLMLDQVKNAKDILKSHSDEIFYYKSNMDINSISNEILNGVCKLLFISPESLIKNNYLKDLLLKINKLGILKNLIVDEAHIIFEWGDSFRLDFQFLDVFKNDLLSFNKNLRTYLLSATFSEDDVNKLKHMYSNGDNWIELRLDSLRKEIQYEFIKCQSYYEKRERLLELVKLMPHPMIIYVSSPNEASEIKEILTSRQINNVQMYTGETNEKDRETILEKWKCDEFSIMVATCAFGVGVDKKDIKTVIHFYLPENINKYYQEAGRGGRDGTLCLSYVLYTDDDIKSIYSKVKNSVLTTDKLIKRWFSMINSNRSSKMANNIINIDTSALPSYYDQNEEKIFVNKADIGWNVYVLLFLKRYGFIDINNIKFNGKFYEMEVRCNDLRLYVNDQELFCELDEKRNMEWTNVEKQCKQMIRMLRNANKFCVSDFFTDIYKKVPIEYCAGCNSHEDVKYGFYDGLPLVSNNSKIMLEKHSNISDTLIETNDIYSAILHNLTNNVSTIVSDGSIDLSKTNHNFNEFSFFEFENLLSSGNSFLFGNSIIIVLPNNINSTRYLSLIQKLINNKEKNILVISQYNTYLAAMQKYLYELIDCDRLVEMF